MRTSAYGAGLRKGFQHAVIGPRCSLKQRFRSINLLALAGSSRSRMSEPAVQADRQDRTSEASTSAAVQTASSFQSLGADERVLANLSKLGIHSPTQVQLEAIPHALEGRNVAIQSYTGSGKTLAYLLPVLSRAVQWAEAEYEALAQQKMAHKAGSLQAIVVAPSRELAMQIVRVGQSLLPASAKACIQQAIGGANVARQVEAIQRNKPLMIVGTPGRLAELSRGGKLLSHSCRVLVLDEMDQLLAPQFREDLVRLQQHVGRGLEQPRQTLIVSATLSDKVIAQCEGFCPQPVQVRIGAERQRAAQDSISSKVAPSWGWGSAGPASQQGGSAGGIGTQNLIPAMPPQVEHAWLSVDARHKVDQTRRAIHALNSQHALIFMNFQSRLKDTEAKLRARGMEVACLSGEMSKEQRQNTLAKFRQGKFRGLVVSDLMARGLDIQDCDAVINLELPSDASHYAHRAGRTGRAGRPGSVLSMVEAREEHVISKLAKRLDIQIDHLETFGGSFQYANQPLVTDDSQAAP